MERKYDKQFKVVFEILRQLMDARLSRRRAPAAAACIGAPAGVTGAWLRSAR